MDKVVVVTVTYNSHNFLKRCINSLVNQTYKIEKILVIDNHSNEENYQKNLTLKSDLVEIIYLDSNTGGAGGFEYGMKYSKKYNPDWVWIMDDDAFPKSDCLERLLLHKDYENLGCICPAIFGDDLKQYQVYHHKKMNKYFKERAAYNNYEDFPDIFEIDANAFVGPLVKQSVIDEIGVADGELFIYGDDTEYTYRISRKYNIVLVKDAVINHRDVIVNDSKNDYKAWWKEYYNYRNRYLLIDEYSKSRFQRNMSILKLKLYVLKRILGSLLKKKYKGYRRLRVALYKQALCDGKKGIKGKVIDPVIYNKQFMK